MENEIKTERKKSMLGILSILLGIIGWIVPFSIMTFLFIVAGLVLALVALSNASEKRGLAIVGLIICGIELLGIVWMIMSSASSMGDSPTEVDELVYVEQTEIENVYASPDDYKGKYITLTGKIHTEPVVEDGILYFQIYADPVNLSKDTVIKYLGTESFTEGEYVKIDGKILGEREYENVLGGEIERMLIETENITKSNYIECCSPTIKEIKADKTVEQHGYSVTVDKIEFAENETRVYLTVENNGSSNFSVYAFNMKMVQDKKQYEYVYDPKSDYEELQTDLLPDTVTSGIVVFPAMNPEKSLKLICEPSCYDWEVELENYIFEF